jgi:hypothetical protein
LAGFDAGGGAIWATGGEAGGRATVDFGSGAVGLGAETGFGADGPGLSGAGALGGGWIGTGVLGGG